MKNKKAVKGAVNILRYKTHLNPNEEVYNSQLVKWLPYLEVEPPHPNDPEINEKLKEANFIFSFFKDVSPRSPFKAFVDHMNSLRPIPHNERRVDQVMRSVRLLKTGMKTKQELDSLGVSA